MTNEEEMARVDTNANSNDSPTASAVAPVSHTPGPWSGTDMGGYIFTEGNPYGSGPMMIGMVRGWGHLTGTGGGCAFDEDKAYAIQCANQRLMAAAPDLLAALYAIQRYVISQHDMALVDAAIAKAEGR